MTGNLTITRQVYFRHGRDGRIVLKEGEAPKVAATPAVPRISRVMALAIHMQELVDHGEVAGYAELGRLGYVTRSRITQIMRLLHLAPDIQEELLFLPRPGAGDAAVYERTVRPIAAIHDWRKQRKMWDDMKKSAKSGPGC